MKSAQLLPLALVFGLALGVAPVHAETVQTPSANPSAKPLAKPLARPIAPNVMQQQDELVTPVIPATAAIVVQLPQNLVVDVGQNQEHPTTVPLAQPIYDMQGNELVPAQSPVSIKVKPENGGARLVATSIVVRGQIVMLQAATDVIPGRTITEKSANQMARENSAVFGNLGGSVGGLFGGLSRRADNFELGGMIGSGIGILSGMGGAKDFRVVEFNSGMVYVLQMQAPVTLPSYVKK